MASKEDADCSPETTKTRTNNDDLEFGVRDFVLIDVKRMSTLTFNLAEASRWTTCWTLSPFGLTTILTYLI